MILLTLGLQLPVAGSADVLTVECAAGVVEWLGDVAEWDLATDRGLHHLCHTAGCTMYLKHSNEALAMTSIVMGSYEWKETSNNYQSYSVHVTVYCVQYTVYCSTVNSIQCTVYSKQCRVYCVQYTVYSLQSFGNRCRFIERVHHPQQHQSLGRAGDWGHQAFAPARRNVVKNP